MNPINILIVEDDPDQRQWLACQIAQLPGCRLLGEASTFSAARDLLNLPADILITDIGLPDGSGLDLITEARARRSDLHILVHSMFPDDRNVLEAVRRGADGYILKGDTSDGLGRHLTCLRTGQSPFSPQVAHHLIAEVAKAPAIDQSPILTARQLELLTCLAEGLSIKSAARVLNISPHTATDYLKAIYRRLNVNSRREAVYEALASGMIVL